MTNRTLFPLHLHDGGVSVVLADGVGTNPSIVYWGRELPDDPAVIDAIAATAAPGVLNSSPDAPRAVSVLPTQADGWSGTPGIAWHEGAIAGYRLVPTGARADGQEVELTFADPASHTAVTYTLRVAPSGLVAVRASIENTGSAVLVDVTALRLVLPVPGRARELLDHTGRWSGERRPQRRAMADGTWLRATHRGRPGHDAPYLTIAGTPGFDFGDGEVWAVHVGWSGNQEHIVERLPEGVGTAAAMIGGGELLEPGEIRLAQGERYESPFVYFAHSLAGVDGVSARFHEEVRSGAAYPEGPRPLVLNTWEAVYFHHDFDTLAALARRAAEIGVERFVLDDGWFLGRRNDRAGLGDWFVDETVWPGGLGRLSDLVHSLGMEFGLWFEPEMVNLDSDVARAHPEWVLGDDAQLAFEWRHQHVLDLSHPDAWAYLRERIDAVVTAAGVDFIKWDHNRDLHAATDRRTGAAAVHAQTLAVYRLMSALREAHPGLEIESCASGGGRIDLGMMSHAQRVWASDTNDPIERQMVQLGTTLLLPPELVGAHVGPKEAHTTHRSTALSFRLATALFGHAGIEWDITRCTDGELDALRAWAGLYKELRPLLHTGTTVHGDGLDDGALLSGVVSADRGHAVYSWAQVTTNATAHTERVRFPGLDPALAYTVRVRTETGRASLHLVHPPAWLPLDGSPVTLPGRVLTEVGVPLPVLNPGNALIVEARAE